MEKLFKRKSLIVLIALFISAFFSAFIIGVTAKAEQQTDASLSVFLPQSKIECYDLSSPVDACWLDGDMAIVHTNELIVFSNGEYKNPVSLISPQQVQKLNDEYLIVSQDGSLYSVNLIDLSVSALTHSSGVSVGCNYFDCNENYIVTAYSQDLKIYAHDDLSISSPTTFEYQIDLSSPISINDKNEIFYVYQDSLYKCTVNDKTGVFLSNDKPTSILANDDFVYIVSNGDIIKISTDGTSRTVLQKNNDHIAYDLGNVVNPVSISFKGENLLISDGLTNSVQEFSITDDKLEFTGFAVAKGKTAYNRIGDTAKSIDLYGDKIAVLDDFKLTIITNNEDGKTYQNFLCDNLSNPTEVILDKDYALCFGDELSLIDLKTSQLKTLSVLDGTPTSIATRFNEIYLTTISSTNINILKFDGETFNVIHTFINAYDPVYAPEKLPVLTVSANRTVFVTHPVEDAIYTLTPTGDGYSEATLPVFTATGVRKMETDLANNLFLLVGDTVQFSDGTTLYSSALKLGDTETEVTSLAMDENLKSVFFTKTGHEGIYTTDDLPNFAVQELKVADFITHGNTADISNYKTYLANTSELFTVNPVLSENGYGFTTNGFMPTKNAEYLLVSSSTITNTFGDYSMSIDFSVIAGQMQNNVNIFAVAKSDTLTQTTEVVSADLDTAYIITDVNAYYLPVISMQDTFTLQKDDASIRLKKGDEINPIYAVNFLNKDFYYASIKTQDGEIYGFVPKNFTVEVLDKDLVIKTYTLEKVKSGVVKDQDGNEKITLSDDTTIRLYSIKDGVALIEYLEDGVWKHGYIDSTLIITKGNVAIRNAIIIILMTASVVATTCYFVFRKKHN